MGHWNCFRAGSGHVVLAVVAFLTLIPAAISQTLAFEAAVVKSNHSNARGSSLPPPQHGRFTAVNVPLKEFILEAYQIQELQLSGGPGWISSEGFDITAKAAGDAKRTEVYQMLQTLLRDRFQLAFHRETKDLPVYTITVAKNGPRMKKNSGEECGESVPGHPCGGFNVQQRRHVWGERVSIAQLANVLSTLAGRAVLDKTALKGTFDIDLEWTPDEGQRAGLDIRNAPPQDNNRPSLFTAMEEQLGLKLDSQRGAVEVLVIDRVERPSDN